MWRRQWRQGCTARGTPSGTACGEPGQRACLWRLPLLATANVLHVRPQRSTLVYTQQCHGDIPIEIVMIRF